MNDNPAIIEIPALFRNKTVKKLTFTEAGLSVEKPLSFDPVINIPADGIMGFRYGMEWLSGYQFTIGRRYIVEIQTHNVQTLPIKLTSLYGIKKKVYLDLWSDVLEQLWRCYFQNLYSRFFNQYKNRDRFNLAGVEFHAFGIMLGDKGLFWDEIALSNYKTYFVIHGRENLKLTRSLNFQKDWNAYLLQKMLKAIIREVDGLKAEEAE